MDSCKVSRAAGAVPTRSFTPPHTPVHSNFFAKMHAIRAAPRVAPSAGLQGHGSGADAADRTPAVAPIPVAAALAVAAATGVQGRRRALRELDAAVVATRRRHHCSTALRRSLRACTSAGAPARARRRRRRRPRGARAPISRPAALERRTAPPARWKVAASSQRARPAAGGGWGGRAWGGRGGRVDRGCGTCDCCAAARLARAPLHVRCRAGAARRPDITTGALGAGLLDVAAGISLLAGMRGNRADAGNQRAVPCDIEEAGTKGPHAFMRRAGFRASRTPPTVSRHGPRPRSTSSLHGHEALKLYTFLKI